MRLVADILHTGIDREPKKHNPEADRPRFANHHVMAVSVKPLSMIRRSIRR